MNEYDKQAVDFLKKTNTTLTTQFLKHDTHFEGETTTRDIYEVKLQKNGKLFVFRFGQSVNNVGIAPSEYDILACLTKYDPGTFEDFCDNFGYDFDSRNAEKIYKAVLREWDNINTMYSDEEIELLQEIS